MTEVTAYNTNEAIIWVKEYDDTPNDALNKAIKELGCLTDSRHFKEIDGIYYCCIEKYSCYGRLVASEV